MTPPYDGKHIKENRIVYAESIFDEGKAPNRLGTHLFDTQLGEPGFLERRRIAQRCTWRGSGEVLGRAADGVFCVQTYG